MPGHDNAPREDYKKTLLWPEPNLDKVIRGSITIYNDGTPPSFDGTFVVPDSPFLDGSRDAKDLTQKNKDDLLALVNSEKTAVDELEKKINEEREEEEEESTRNAPGNLFGTLLPLRLRLDVPQEPVVNVPVHFHVTATSALRLEPAEIIYYWDFGSSPPTGLPEAADIVTTFPHAGTYRVAVTAVNFLGAAATEFIRITATAPARSPSETSP